VLGGGFDSLVGGDLLVVLMGSGNGPVKYKGSGYGPVRYEGIALVVDDLVVGGAPMTDDTVYGWCASGGVATTVSGGGIAIIEVNVGVCEVVGVANLWSCCGLTGAGIAVEMDGAVGRQRSIVLDVVLRGVFFGL
jgi:hypothetical protein